MSRRLYLHIGYPKTGTTALQCCMVDNSERLAEMGVLYPHTGRIAGAHYAFNFALGIGDYDPSLNVQSSVALRTALRAEIERSDCDKVVVSSEYFSIATAIDVVRDFFSEYDTKIVAYLRRHDHALESAYSQAVKTVKNPQWGPSIESFTLHQLTALDFHYDYLATLNVWAKWFGKDAIIVRPFERAQNVPDIFTDFFTAIGLVNAADGLVRPANLNPSLGTDAISAILAIRNARVPDEVKTLVVGRVVQISERSTSPRPHLSAAAIRSLVTRYGPTYAAIAREFLGRTDGVLFREAIPKPSDAAPVAPPPDPDATLDIVLRAVADRLR